MLAAIAGLESVLNVLMTYRLHVYCLTFLLVFTTYIGPPYSLEAYLVSLSFASLMAFIYLANKVTDTNEDSVNIEAGPISVSARSVTMMAAWVAVAAPVAYIVSLGDTLITASYVLTAVLGFLYSFPIPYFGTKWRFKQVLFLKTTTSSIIWALPPAATQASQFGLHSGLWLFLLVFCIGAAMEIVWDIRDMRGDKQFSIHTIPNTLGITTAQAVAIGALMIAGIFAQAFSGVLYTYLGLTISALFASYAREGKKALYFHAIVFVWIVLLGLRAVL